MESCVSVSTWPSGYNRTVSRYPPRGSTKPPDQRQAGSVANSRVAEPVVNDGHFGGGHAEESASIHP